MQQSLHFFFHVIFPFFIAFFFYKKHWKRTYLLFLLTMLVDLDHLLASPIWDPHRCSIGFHPLHSYAAIVIYIILLFFPKPLRLIAIGLLLHMLADYTDCQFM